MPEIEITIDNDGSLKLEALGCAGPGCQQLTAAIEQALGRVTSDQRKPEFAATQSAIQAQQARQASQGAG